MAVGSESLVVRVEDTSSTLAAKGAVQSVVGGSGAGLSSVLSFTGVAVAAGASLVINQMTYHRKMSEMLEMYRDEVATQLGKPLSKVTQKDLELVGNGDTKQGIAANKIIAEGVGKLKSRRNIGMLITTASILATVGFLLATGLGGAAIFGTGSLAATAGTFIVKAAMGVAIHSVMERPMHWAAKKLFKMEDTTNDLISELKLQHRNGKSISREQVVEVFVSANEQLGDFVKGQYGKDFADLSVQDKRAVTDAFEQYLPVTNITENINSGRVKISELAFAVEGQASGVAPDSVKDSLSLVGKARQVIHAAPKRAVVEYDNPVPERSFVARLEESRAVGPRTI